jgi:hypothetical protein
MPRSTLPNHRRPARPVARAYSVRVDDALYRGVLVGRALAILGFWLPIAAWLLRG